MPDADRNPTGRFSGLADAYANYRPSYPDEAVHVVSARAGLKPNAVIVDVGCGTGISTRLFAERGFSVIGIEPNAEMRHRAEMTPCLNGPPPLYRDGTAEATGLPTSSAECVVSAQAFHWFDPGLALREFHRVLKPGGWVALLWNERDETDQFTRGVGDVIRTGPDAVAIESARARAGDALATYPLFCKYVRQTFRSASMLDLVELKGRAFSASYAPKEESGRAALAAGLEKQYARFQIDGRVPMCYETTLHMAQRC
jgi:SAM-dependent methyltransferase